MYKHGIPVGTLKISRFIEAIVSMLISAELEWIPSTTVTVTDEQVADVSKLIEKLEQDEDVQKVFHNMG